MARAPETGRRRLRPEQRTIRVLVADPSPSTRAGVRLALESNDCSVCAEAGDAAGAVQAALRERPDISLLDTRLPGDGIGAAAEIAAKLPETAVVMFTDSDSDADVFAALRAGASGYLLKDLDPARLPVVLHSVFEGEAALPRKLVTKLIVEYYERERRRGLPLRRHLTSREFEVLELLRDSLTTAQIAERLFVAPVTVRTHVASILKKLGVPDRVGAISLLDRR